MEYVERAGNRENRRVKWRQTERNEESIYSFERDRGEEGTVSIQKLLYIYHYSIYYLIFQYISVWQ